MTDEEFDVLDELYFVSSYPELKSNTGFEDDVLREVLKQLAVKGWIKVLRNSDDEVPFVQGDFEENYRNYFYLASKAGLLAHNGR